MNIPGFIAEVGKDHVVVRISNQWEGMFEARITRGDLSEYYQTYWGMSSSIRRLGEVYGDWRPINDLAEIIGTILAEGAN